MSFVVDWALQTRFYLSDVKFVRSVENDIMFDQFVNVMRAYIIIIINIMVNVLDKVEECWQMFGS